MIKQNKNYWRKVYDFYQKIAFKSYQRRFDSVQIKLIFVIKKGRVPRRTCHFNVSTCRKLFFHPFFFLSESKLHCQSSDYLEQLTQI